MKYKTLFRLALKVIGVYMVATGIPAIIFAFIQIAQIYFSQFNNASFSDMWFFSSISSMVTPAIGLYLFFGGEWIVNKAIPSNRPYCHECGYELTQATTNTCPECGTEFKPMSSE